MNKPAPAVKAAPLTAHAAPAPAGNAPAYLGHMKKQVSIKLDVGMPCEVWELECPTDPKCLSEWAKRFRETYCLDADIDTLRKGTGKSRADFLLTLVFPDEKAAPGPGVRAGDFAELLISDFVEFRLGYWVPREKYGEKGSRNESVKGVDIVGFKCTNVGQAAPTDEMLTFEVKAQLTDRKYEDRLQVAVDDSGKDYLRAAETLAAMKRRMYLAGKTSEMLTVQRFQNAVDRPYQMLSGAAAVLSDKAFDAEAIRGTSVDEHNNAKHLQLIAVKGKSLMQLAHALYQRAADEA